MATNRLADGRTVSVYLPARPSGELDTIMEADGESKPSRCIQRLIHLAATQGGVDKLEQKLMNQGD